ncbi:MAG: hypothetical protein J5994_01370 [Ruminococcus sp.]|nr:hypothetical protein [Ruminococcus sp.]
MNKVNACKKKRKKTKAERTKGAVSVFLVMILVPCLVVTSLFTDLARVKLSKDISNNAADLALNSLMTNYDADLSEWYGMVSSCQSIDEFYDLSAQYFLRMLSSQNLSTDEVALLSDYYSAATQNGAIYDFLTDYDTKKSSDLLGMEVETEQSKIVGPVENANLGNPVMVKEQVIEYMKYRAPIEITTNIIDRLTTNDSTLTEFTGEASKNQPLVEAKEDFYETEGEFTSAAYHSYWAIREYSDEKLTKEILKNDYVGRYDGYKQAYKEMHTNAVKYLYNTKNGGLTVFDIPVYNIDDYTGNDDYNEKAICTEEVDEEQDDGTEITRYYITNAQVENVIDGLASAVLEFEDKIDGLNGNELIVELAGYIDNPGVGDGDSQVNPIQWWVKADGVSMDITDEAEELMKNYAKVKSIDSCDADNRDGTSTDIGGTKNSYCKKDFWGNDVTDNAGNSLTYNHIVSMAESYYNNYLKAMSNDSNYGKVANKYDEISTNTANKNLIMTSQHNVTVDGAVKGYDDALNYMSTQLTDQWNYLKTLIGRLKIAIEGGTGDKGRVKSLQTLKSLASEYASDLGTWTDEANGSTTDMGRDDRGEISRRSEDQLIHKITADNVDALELRLKNIRSLLTEIKDLIDSLKYNGTAIKSIKNFSTFKSKMGSLTIPLTNAELDQYAEDTFKFEPESINEPANLNDPAYDPYLDPEDSSADIPELYGYMHEQYKDTTQETKDAVDNAEDEQDAAKEDAANKEEEAKKGTCLVPEGRSDLCDLSGDNKVATSSSSVSLGSVLESIATTFSTMMDEEGLSGAAEDLRDSLYTTVYIRHMFSFGTYENEGLYGRVKAAGDDKVKELTLNNYEETYKKEDYMGIENPADPDSNKGRWLSASKEDAFNKSLTNNLINANNNYIYSAEIEYILYGGKNKDNIDKAIGEIYTIRYALNLVSGFQHFWKGTGLTGGAINTAAAAIQAATAGVVPAAVTKAILIPILTIFETFYDIQRLKAGFPVEIYKKDANMWWFSLESLSSDEAGGAKSVSGIMAKLKSIIPEEHPNPDNGLFYSDYITLFLFSGLTASSTEKVMYERMSEVIQMNMRQLIDGSSAKLDSGFQMKKSVTYFKLEADIRVRPLMITLPIFNEYDNNLQDKKDWCSYKIKAVRGYA